MGAIGSDSIGAHGAGPSPACAPGGRRLSGGPARTRAVLLPLLHHYRALSPGSMREAPARAPSLPLRPAVTRTCAPGAGSGAAKIKGTKRGKQSEVDK